MNLVPFIILLLAVVPDMTLRFSSFGMEGHFQLAPLFLCYVLFRKSFAYLFLMLFLYTIIVTPFSGMGFTPIFFSFIITFGLFHKLRQEIYIESYLIQGFWAFLILLIQWVLIYILDSSIYAWSALSDLFFTGLVNSLLMAALSVPLFLFLDYILEVTTRRRYRDRQSGDGFFLEPKRRSNHYL